MLTFHKRMNFFQITSSFLERLEKPENEQVTFGRKKENQERPRIRNTFPANFPTWQIGPHRGTM